MATNSPASTAAELSAHLSAEIIHISPSQYDEPLARLNINHISLFAFSSDSIANLRAAAIKTKSSQSPVFILADASVHNLAKITTSLSQLDGLPVVLNLATADGDYAPTDILRSTQLPFFHSPSSEDAVVNTTVATKTALNYRCPVIHLFDARKGSANLDLPNLNISALQNYIGAPIEADSVDSFVEQAYASWDIVGIPARTPFRYTGPSQPTSLVFALCSTISIGPLLPYLHDNGVAVLEVLQYRPLNPTKLLNAIPESVTSIISLDQAFTRTTKWPSLYLDILAAFSQSENRTYPHISSASITSTDESKAQENSQEIIEAIRSKKANHHYVGFAPKVYSSEVEFRVPKHEEAYYKILDQVFPGRLHITNSPENVAPPSTQSAISPTSPEYALGRVLAEQNNRQQLKEVVKALFTNESAASELQRRTALSNLLTSWLKSSSLPSKDIESINHELTLVPGEIEAFGPVKSLSQYFASFTEWIVGSEVWSHDLGNSGVHHALSSGSNINLLLIDSTPYNTENGIDPDHRKKDLGLYAMNYGNAYVASIAAYADYGQAVRAFVEAERYPGPSIILAYLPNGNDDSVQALEVLKQTKQAIDSGFWPLYRWDPSLESKNEEVFQLDSVKIKKDLSEFLDRQNHLTQLSLGAPILDESLEGTPAEKVAKLRESKAKAAFDRLANAISGPPLLVLYASDGGNAEKMAKRLTNRAKARGLGARASVFDEFSLSDLELETNVVFVTSTAGQGEFPQNGRILWKAIGGLKEHHFTQLQYSVFGLGDSHYWPRPEDKHYYNKPAKDLDKKLSSLGGQILTELGLGDDQDADGPQTGYREWEQRLWKSLGVGDVEIVEAEPEPITNEHIKIASNYLRGTIAEGLVDKSTGALAESDGQLTKFHGIYQQDDRDIRDQRKEQGLEPAYSFMVRVRMPGGVCRPEQWLQIDEISGRRGNNTFKLTTRSTFQFHGIIKSNLKPAIQEINRALLDTVAACGDVNRNVTCSAYPSLGKLHEQVFKTSKEISERLLPKTNAYAEIWLDKKMIAGDAIRNFSEPLYGPYYLPRKFKIGVAVPPSNDVDIFTNDVGLIAIVDPTTGDLQGFNVSIGGGMGVTHAMKKTYPRLGDVIGFVTPDEASNICEKVMLVQRDNGDRTNRKQARLKYTIDRMTLPVFKAEVEKRLGYQLAPAKEFKFDRNVDDFGWHVGEDGQHHFTVFIENGRVQDEPGKPFRTGLREIAKVHKGVFRLTANQHLIIADIPPEERQKIEKLLHQYKLDDLEQSGLRKSSSACVAFPTCGLAMAESERYLPLLIDKVEKMCEDAGLRNDAIVMRMTGCPNGCARPYAAEIAFVGKAPGQYLMLLGGGFYGQRLNKIYKESVNEEQILEVLKPMIQRYAKERNDGEHFGDWTIRAGYITAVESGAKWYEGMATGDK